MPLLHDENIALRAVEPTDLDVLYRWENDTSLWAIGSSIAPYTRKQIWDYIENYDSDIYATRQLRLIIELWKTKDAIGTIDLYDFDPTHQRAALGILIDSDYVNNGYGTSAIMLMLQYAKAIIGLHQIYAYVPVDNKPSIALFNKCGFKSSGCLRSWLRRGQSYCDVLILQAIL
jgi:diamine N-acetyltransferase